MLQKNFSGFKASFLTKDLLWVSKAVGGAKGRETGYLNLSHLEAVPSGTWPLQDESDQGKPQGLFTSHFCSHCFNHNWSRDSKEAGKGGFLEVLKGKEAMFWWTLFLPHYHWVLRRHKDSSSTQVKTTAWILGMFRHHARHWWFPETSLNDCTPKGALLAWGVPALEPTGGW